MRHTQILRMLWKDLETVLDRDLWNTVTPSVQRLIRGDDGFPIDPLEGLIARELRDSYEG